MTRNSGHTSILVSALLATGICSASNAQSQSPSSISKIDNAILKQDNQAEQLESAADQRTLTQVEQDKHISRIDKALESEDSRREKEDKNKAEQQKTQAKEREKQKENEKARPDAPCISWVKFGVPVKAVLLCVHGLGLNSSSYEKFGTDMAELGIATYAIDVRGFGSWVKAKGQTKIDFAACIDDVEDTLEWLHKSHVKKPVFLMGESMGGAIALHTAAQYPDLMNGVISVCSAGDRFKQKRTDLEVFLHALVGPNRKFNIGKQIVDQATGNDTELKRSWEGDELDRMKLSPIELMKFQHFMNENHEEAKKITNLPVLMVQGNNDPLVKPEGTEELFNELKTPDKEIMMVQNAKHLIFEDQQFSDLTLSGVANWIFKHCPQPTPFELAMERSQTAMDSGRLPAALVNAKSALELNPKAGNAHLLMGQIQSRMQHPLIARAHLIQAIRLAKNPEISERANKALMQLPQNVLGPVAGARIKANTNPKAKPSVLVFNANWCRPCQDMNDIVEQAKVRCENRVDFTIIDVDDPKNERMVDDYGIGPVPTTVFLNAEGTVASLQVGYGGIDGMLKGLSKITRIK